MNSKLTNSQPTIELKVNSPTANVDITGGGGLYILPVASPTTLGGVKPDETTTTVDEDGTIHSITPIATTTTVGSVKPDGTTITIDNNGVITADIPTKTSDLTNDSDFITTEYHDITKQNVLIPGDNITISADNVISATGVGSVDALATKEELSAVENKIPAEYVKSAAVADNKLTLTKQDNTVVEFEGGGGGLQNLVDGTEYGSVQGKNASATGFSSFAMGYSAEAKGTYSIVFGEAASATAASTNGICLGKGNSLDGRNTVCIGTTCRALYSGSIAIGDSAKAYGASNPTQYNNNIAIGSDVYSGYNRETQTYEGRWCLATNTGTSSSGLASFAEGCYTQASGGYGSHSEGYYTISTHQAQHAQGTYNIRDASTEEKANKGTYAIIVGNGTSDSARSNAYTLDWQGNGTFSGTVSSATGADYAEYFEWKDGNLNNEDRVGYIVCLDGDKIVKANTGDDILGICSGTAMVLGDSAEWNWSKRYLTDDFGRIIYEDYDVEHEERKNEETGEVIEEAWTEHIHAPKQNPDYDVSQPYTKRADRPEWQIVGMMGKLYVRDDGSCVVNGYADVKDGIATKATGKTNMRVMARVNENIVRVLLK